MTYPSYEPQPSDSQPYQHYPAYPPPPAATPPPAYEPPLGYAAPPGYGAPPPNYFPYGPPRREHEGLAIASLVVSCSAILGFCTWGIAGVLGIVGAILGHVARSRLKHNGKAGAGLALAGIIVGWVLAALSAVVAVLIILVVVHSGNTSGGTSI